MTILPKISPSLASGEYHLLNLQVLRRVHPNSLADQWNKRSGHGRLVANLLLLSVNGQEEEEDIMRPAKSNKNISWVGNTME